MVAFQPIEDAGPRLAFGVIHFLRVFVAAASPGVLEKTPQGGPWTPPDCSSELRGRDGTMVIRNLFGRKKGFQEIF